MKHLPWLISAMAVSAVLAGDPVTPVYVIPNFHPASCGWLADWSTERNYCANSYFDHLDRVRDDATYSFALSECNNLIAMLNFAPQRFAELKQRVKEGRVELCNAFFLEPTINLSGGEALVKMGVEGLRWQQEVMGARPRFCWAIDVCGVHEQMPQICRSLGLDGLVYTRCNPLGRALFWSESPEGSRILCLAPHHYDDFELLFQSRERLTRGQLQELAGEAKARAVRTPEGAPVLILGGSSDYSLAPLHRENPTEFLQQWRSLYPNREIRLSTLSKYVDTLCAAMESRRIDLPTVHAGTSNTYDSFWIQCPRVKQWYRRDEHALQAAESLAAIASLKSGYPYPVQTLYRGWLQMLLNMDRNTLWGAAGGMVFESDTSWDVRDRFEWVEQACRATLAAASRALLGTATGAGLFNAANWQRNDPLSIDLPPGTHLAGATCEAAEDGTTICRLDLPSVGIAGVELSPGSPPSPREIQLPATIETAFYSARIDPRTGDLISLKVKPSGREMLSGAANVVVAEQHKGLGSEDPGDYTAPRPERRRLASSSEFAAKLSVREGPLAVTVEAQSVFYGGGHCRRVTRLYQDHPRIDFQTELSDISNLTVVVVEFPLTQAPREVRRGIPFGFSHGAWAQPNAALTGWTKGIVPAVRWTDYALPGGGGIALLDRGLTGRELNGQTPILYLFNAMDKYYGYTNSWLSGKGTHRFEYAVLAHDADWQAARVPQLAWEYNCPVTLATGCAPAAAQSLVQTSDNLILEALRREGSDLELRLGECLGIAGTAEITLKLPHEQAALTELTGGHATKLEGGPTYRFAVRPQQIVTLRFRTREGVAAIQPLLEWDELVPPAKRAALRRYLKEAKGHPPTGS